MAAKPWLMFTCIFCLALFPIGVRGQELNVAPGSLSWGLGQSKLAAEGATAAFGNPAQLLERKTLPDSSQRAELYFSAFHFYHTDAHSGGRAAYVYGWRQQALAFAGSFQGNRILNRARISLAFASRMGRMQLGLKTQLDQWAGEAMQSVHMLSFSAGGAIAYFDKWRIYALADRVAPYRFQQVANPIVAGALLGGARFRWQPEWQVFAEAGQQVFGRTVLRMGLGYSWKEQFTAALGYNALSGALSIGFLMTRPQLQYGMGSAWQALLGPAYHVDARVDQSLFLGP